MEHPAPQPALYVAPDGNDAWSGRLPRPNREGTDGPVATLSRARDLARPMRTRPGARRLIEQSRVLALLLNGLKASQDHGYLPGADLRRQGLMFWSTVHGAVRLRAMLMASR